MSALFLALTIAGLVVMVYYWQDIVNLQKYGYLGAFLIAFVAGSSIPIPISYIIVTFTLGGVLNPLLIGVASGVGAGTGGTLVYLFGLEGGRLIPRIDHFSVDETASSYMARFANWAQSRGSLVVFLMSAVFNPMFAPMAITMGALRFRLVKFFGLCVAGNIVKSLIISYAGYFGVGALLRWLQYPFPQF